MTVHRAQPKLGHQPLDFSHSLAGGNDAGFGKGAAPTSTGDAPEVSDPEGLIPTLSRLMIWLSPAYPVGGFSYSHGLEWTVEAGKVRDAATLGGWIEDILKHGAGRPDAILLAHAWRAVRDADDPLL